MTEPARDLFGLIDALESDNWLIRETEVAVGDRRICLARDPNHHAAILVPVEGRSASTLFRSRGITARIGPLSDGGELRDWLIVSCSASHLEETFFVLCDDVLGQVVVLGDAGNAVEETLGVVERWRALMERISSPLLSPPACAGLLAELHAMEQLLPIHGADATLNAWAGPERARIDFRFDDLGIEVKATTGRDRFRVTIHGLLQLDDTAVGDLRLYAEQLEQVPSGGDSIPAAVQRLVAQGVSESELKLALGRVGYYPADEDAYAQLMFKVLQERGVRVGPGTPRIVAASFKEASHAESVSSVDYVLDLTEVTEAQGRLALPADVFAKELA